MPNVHKLTFLIYADQQRPKILASAARFCKTANHDFLAHVGFYLEPQVATDVLAVLAICLLGDNTFQTLLLGFLEQRYALSLDMIAVTDNT